MPLLRQGSFFCWERGEWGCTVLAGEKKKRADVGIRPYGVEGACCGLMEAVGG